MTHRLLMVRHICQMHCQFLKFVTSQTLLKGGKSVNALKAEVTTAEYSDWIQDDGWRDMNVEGIAEYLTEADLVN
ncbi:hypothetical protein N9L47_08125 [Rhodobacteraceae bacterium]|nr:hypothetical protein [Paracoccaceae bacterium]